MNDNTLQKALDVFHMKYSELSEENVRQLFKKLAFDNHSDTSKGREPIDMDALTNAKKILLEQCLFITGEKSSGRLRKITPEEVFMTNKKLCPECEGYGDIEHKDFYQADCDSCDGHGLVMKCKHCTNGKFKNKSGRIVDCRVCKGTGVYGKFHSLGNIIRYKRYAVICEKCEGTGKQNSNIYRTYYTPCYHCHTEGYIDVKNPIFKENSLA